ncbi:Mannosyl-glycoprotein endo-beta-N-acetylglucosaminidase [Paenibacillus sp. RU4T]|jgi:hypothetical protein|uniref:glucosaminidase domain-containing protein n=1 Tax=unclassified Paenibacillus TaxID=185978 RepID=UPI000955DC99|nr:MULTISPECIES: glucosaminidase domain-containing protein [unclassified Paenibacillus]SIR50468.1 Mannosyl-glycoprotein endo-beta-N-acetylglucosaminidase [Paenibacillus sp. RU4X]SIR59542.1 Mannosyl-glycoprotein endo-beta-N-acetylglucosaminidase [Paenibacillus sp. RU4T]
MPLTAIPTTSVTCGTTTDTKVSLNPNTDTADHWVQAFVDCFSGAAATASSNCYNLPVKLILALWGGESAYGKNSTQQANQNWANMTYTSSTNPPGNTGSGTGGWAKFCGRNTFATGFAGFLKNNTPYKDLITYLKGTSSPNENTCARYLADAGYGGSNHDAYYTSLTDWMYSICLHSDYC